MHFCTLHHTTPYNTVQCTAIIIPSALTQDDIEAVFMKNMLVARLVLRQPLSSLPYSQQPAI